MESKTSNMILRRAVLSDASSIAYVHQTSWRETYKELMPATVCNKMAEHFDEALWQKILAAPVACHDYWVVEKKDAAINAVVGFVSVCPSQLEKYSGYGEVAGIYLLSEHHGLGLGKSLLKKGFASLKDNGFRYIYLWVLKGNPAEDFYMKIGAKPDGEKVEEVFGHKLTFVYYVWDNIENMKFA